MSIELQHWILQCLSPFASIGLIVLVLNWIFKKSKIEPESIAGVTPRIRPFETREEFLRARLEMDLETFLERAHVTPTHITHKPQTKPCKFGSYTDVVIEKVGGPGFGGATDIVGLPGSVIGAGGSGGSFPNGMPGGAGGNAGNPVAVDVPGLRCFAGHPGTPGTVGVPDQEITIKVGAWYRDKITGELLRLCENRGNIGWFDVKFGGHRYVFYCDVELAIPRVGENWIRKFCKKHYGIHDEYNYQVAVVTSALELLWATCGCVVPFEFGTGKV